MVELGALKSITARVTPRILLWTVRMDGLVADVSTLTSAYLVFRRVEWRKAGTISSSILL